MICITGDTHIPIDIDKLDPDNFPEQSQMTKADYVIVCGDFGLIWNYRGENKTEIKWREWLNERPFTIFMSFGTIFGVGGTSLIARSLGEGRTDYARVLDIIIGMTGIVWAQPVADILSMLILILLCKKCMEPILKE